MKEKYLEEINKLSPMLSRYEYFREIDSKRFDDFIFAKHESENPGKGIGNHVIHFNEFIYYVKSDESIRIKAEIKQFLESIGSDIVILETLKDIGKDFIYWHDYTMNYRDTFNWYYKMNKQYKSEQTVEYFLSKMSLKYIGYLYYGYAASFGFLDNIDKKKH